jgi:hypothetical protein
MFTFRAVLSTLALIATLAGCGPDSQSRSLRALRIVPAPSNVFAAARLDDARLVLLTGQPGIRTVHVVRVADGADESLFGVAKESMAVQALSERGPLVIAFGGRRGNASIGAIEIYDLSGKRLGTFALPIAAADLTQALDGAFYVLLSNGSERAALRVDSRTFRINPVAIALPPNAAHLRQCSYQGTRYLLASGGGGKIILTNPVNRKIETSSIFADEAICPRGRDNVVFALLHVHAPDVPIRSDESENELLRVSLPSLYQTNAFPTSRDAVTLVPLTDDLMVEIDSSQGKTTLRTIDLKRLERPQS